MRCTRLLGPIALLLALTSAARAQEPTAEAVAFFETKVRPVLVEHCYQCHSSKAKKLKGGLRVDGRDHLLKGGDGGPAVVPGSPAKSKLLDAVSYKNVDLQMPPKAKLPDAVVADLERWVALGAPWPKESGATDAANKDVFDLERRKRTHWSWAPVRAPTPPTVRDGAWPRGAVDRFILARLEAANLRPSPPAERRVLGRRLWFDLIGLPPPPEALDAFAVDSSPDATAKVVDGLLADPRFGERWGRHWLDLVRYAETRGHEFDPIIPNASHYRDYVVRALNADVPYDAFVREHLAGDLITPPRRHPALGFNESVLGTGFWLFGEEVHSPVDIRQDQADRFDNRIDVFSKAFLGLTVACARCHDHKFDAISQKDYYALFGVLGGASPRLVPFEALETHRVLAAELAAARRTGQETLTKALGNAALPVEPGPRPRGVVVDFARDGWTQNGFAFRLVRAGEVVVGAGPSVRRAARDAVVYDRAWDVLRAAPGAEMEAGALGGLPFRPGRTLRTPTFPLTSGKLFYLVRGAGAAYAAVCGHNMIAGPLHGKLVTSFPASAGFRWVAHDLSRYAGLPVHIEFTPALGSEFAVALVVEADAPPPPSSPDDGPDLTRLSPAVVEAATALLAEEKRIAEKIPRESRLALALLDGPGLDERLFVRGSPKAPGDVVPRRFLEALAGTTPLAPAGSGRLELARQLTDPRSNPYLARVAVNRVWHHLFGRGLVASVDNFGALGEAPTHPELLDHLAERFVAEGWSSKRLVRELVLSSTYAQASEAEHTADTIDPQNRLLHRAPLRRLEGEAIRDALLSVSGRLDGRMFGLSVPIHLTPFLDGRGRPGSGPLDGDGRRSVYLAVKRNFLSPFLLAFDTPTPFSTVGRRTVSNVPAQALILLNDPFVHQMAEIWAKRELARSGTDEERLRRMYAAAFGRRPEAEEVAACRHFLAETARRHGASVDDPRVWTDLAHTLVNVKEFIYLR